MADDLGRGDAAEFAAGRQLIPLRDAEQHAGGEQIARARGVDHFLDRFAVGPREHIEGFAPESIDALKRYHWPGNVRELENALERAVVVAADSEISVAHLPDVVRATDAQPLVTNEPPPNPSMEVIEKAYIEFVLTSEGGNESKAAEVLGIAPSPRYRKLNRYGIEV